MGLLLKNATYINWDSLDFQQADILVETGEGGGIQLLKPGQRSQSHTLDCSNKLVTKSLAIGHHHVYSALARGMPPPPKKPGNFPEILRSIWWTLDKCLDPETIRYSALATAAAAARAGATFVIDHHASPGHIEGSLDIISEAFQEVGVGHLLCYEATDRDGMDKAKKGLSENRRYLGNNQGLVGLHASFTVGEDTLRQAVEIMEEFQSGIHIHAAEDLYDQIHCRKTHHMNVVERLHKSGVLNSSKTILVHGLHLEARERETIRHSQCWVAQNMESNLKNRVGMFRADGMGHRIMLGTDGMHSDMFRSAQAAFFAGQVSEAPDPDFIYRRMRNVHRYLQANNFKGDGENNLMVLDYDTPTPVSQTNFTGHLLFGMHQGHVKDVISSGRLIVKDGVVQTIDQEKMLKESARQSQRLWKAIEQMRSGRS